LDRTVHLTVACEVAAHYRDRQSVVQISSQNSRLLQLHDPAAMSRSCNINSLTVMPKLWALRFAGYIAAQREGNCRRRHSISHADFNFGSTWAPLTRGVVISAG
jgi:hypothetical protein